MNKTIFQIKETACFTGHRPNKLGGYNMKNPIMLQLKESLLSLMNYLIEERGVKQFISGGALGTDTAGFWCVEIMKKEYPFLKNILAIPFLNQDKKWTQEQKMWYQKMKKRSDQIIDVSRIKEYDTGEYPHIPYEEYSKYKMQKRNEFMVDNSYFVIAVFDGSKGGTYNCLKYASQAIEKKEIWVINPKKNFEIDVLSNFSA